MSTDNMEVQSNILTCIEGELKGMEEDLDVDDADFQVVDCWEDGEGEEEEDEENHASQNEGTNIPDVHQESSLDPRELHDKISRKHRPENMPDDRISESDISKIICVEDKGDCHKTVQKSKEIKIRGQQSSCNLHEKICVKTCEDCHRSSKNASKNSRQSESLSKEKDRPKNVGKGNYDHSQSKVDQKYKKDSSKHTSKSNEKLDILSDPTEQKVDNFLKEMALQHPQVNSLDGPRHHGKSVDRSSGKILNAEARGKPNIDPSDLPPGVDLEQVAEDTSTLNLLAASKAKINSSDMLGQSTRNSGRGCPNTSSSQAPVLQELEEGTAVKSCRIDGRLYADYSKIIPKDKHDWSKSPHRSYQSGSNSSHTVKLSSTQKRSHSSGRHYSSSPSRGDRCSHSPSLSLSPSPPRLQHWSPTTSVVRDCHLSPSENRPQKFMQYPRQLTYRSPSMERNYYKRSRDSSVLRALSRSLSRERLHHRSRSRSRSKSFDRRQSKSVRRQSRSIEYRRKKYTSTSRSKSPCSRIRSRSSAHSGSSSPDRERYRRARSPSLEDNKPKRPRLSSRTSRSRSRSRGRSPWRPQAEVKLNEWFNPVLRQNGSHSNLDDVRLEHDMERFIATNMAATGQSRQPVLDWLEMSNGKDFKSLSESTFELMDQSMPIPPPPPDISELMTVEEREEEVQIIPDQNVSLSSLLESAVSGVPSQAVIDRCQDAIMKLHDVGIKQGRLNIVPHFIEPQQSLPASFPWQSILHRPTCDKIHFSYTKRPDNPIFWKVPEESEVSSEIHNPLKGVQESSYSQHSETPIKEATTISNSLELERSTLLEKIAFLTKELHEVKQILDNTQVLKISVAVQTEHYSPPCVECERRKELRADVTQTFHPRPLLKSSHLPAPSISFSPSSSSAQSPPSLLPFSYSSSSSSTTHLHGPNIQTAPTPLMQTPSFSPSSASVISSVSRQTTSSTLNISSQLFPSLFSPSAPQPVPPPIYPKAFPQNPRLTSESTAPASSFSANAGNSSFSANAGNSKPPWVPMVTSSGSLTGMQTISSSSVRFPAAPQASKFVGEQHNRQGGATEEKSHKPVPPPPKKNLKPVGGIVDYQIVNHQMVGDEHMFDLVAYLSTTGPPISVDPMYCSPGQTVDKLLNLFSSKGGFIKNQIIIMVGVYNFYNNSWDAYLKKYAHLVGFLRKRCSHLILIEPPPIPRLVNSVPYWKSVEALLTLLKSYKSDSVSVVLTHERLMPTPQKPNPEFYVNDKRLSGTGLQVIAEELHRVLNQAKAAKKGMTS